MTGGSGRDRFAFWGNATSTDTITDFEVGLDNLEFYFGTVDDLSITHLAGDTVVTIGIETIIILGQELILDDLSVEFL